jgi:putative Ca2+/H+ antiporter (TMEM165/GDT1 family)
MLTGSWAAERLPLKVIRLIAAVSFAALGVLALLGVLT